MKEIRDLIQPESVFLDLSGKDKFEVIHNIISRLKDHKQIHDLEQFEKEVIRREKEIPTGLQTGTALPHARSKAVGEIIMAFARLQKGVDFGAGDSQPAHLIFLFGVPNDQINDYLKLAAKLCYLLRQEKFRSKLINARSVKEVVHILKKT